MNKYFLSAILLLVLNTASAQGAVDIKVKKPGAITREFLYKGKPVSPLALIHLFSVQDAGVGIDTVYLRKYTFRNEIRHDSIYHSGWKKDYQQQRSYSADVRYNKNVDDYYIDTMQYEDAPDLVSYTVLGNTSGGKFIVLGHFKTGSKGRWTARVFILDIKGDFLVRLASFAEPKESNRLLEWPVEISNDTITWGNSRYPIPASAR